MAAHAPKKIAVDAQAAAKPRQLANATAMSVQTISVIADSEERRANVARDISVAHRWTTHSAPKRQSTSVVQARCSISSLVCEWIAASMPQKRRSSSQSFADHPT